MQKIQLKDKTFRPFISYEEISSAIDKVADKINAEVNAQGCQQNMFMKMSAWFTAAQVEPIKTKA